MSDQELCVIHSSACADESDYSSEASTWPPKKEDVERLCFDNVRFSITDDEYQRILDGEKLAFLSPDADPKHYLAYLGRYYVWVTR